MKTVTSLVQNGAWWRWSAAAGTARMPGAMALLALLFLGQEATGSYASGTALAGVYALSEALSAPVRGRALDRLSAPARRTAIGRSLWESGVVLAVLGAAGHGHAPMPWLLILASLAAGLSAGAPGGYRALLAELVDDGALPTLLSWDAAILEIEWLLAPLLVSLALVLGGATAAVIVMAGFAIVAGSATRVLPPPVAESAIDIRACQTSAWRQRRAWPTCVTSLGLGIGEGGLIAVLPALLVERGQSAALAGAVAAVIAGSSALGGIALGAVGHRLRGSPSRRSDWALLAMCLAMLPAAFVTSATHLVVLLACGGVFIAPINALRAEALHDALPPELHSEGFSIQNGANGVGVAAGAAIVAALHASPSSALAASLSVPLLCIAGTTVLRQVHRRAGSGAACGAEMCPARWD